MERAEDTVRIVRAYTDVLVDLPTSVASARGARWLAVTGSRALHDAHHEVADEASIVHFLIAGRAERELASSTASPTPARTSVPSREVVPREAWKVVTTCTCTWRRTRSDGVSRRSRSRFADRVIADANDSMAVLSADDEPRPRL